MTIAPAIFLGGIGVHARAMLNGWDFVENDPKTEASILRYGQFLGQIAPGLREGHIESTRDAATKWVANYQNGTLPDLNPIAYDDTTSDGVKSQIFLAKSRLCALLSSHATKSLQEGNSAEGMKDLTIWIKLGDAGKFSDFISLFNGTTEQRRVIYLVEKYRNKFSKDQLRTIASELDQIKHDQKAVERLTVITKHNFLTYRNRHGDPPLSIEDSSLVSELPALVKGDALEAVQSIKQRGIASNDTSIPNFVSGVRLGIASQANLDVKIAEFKKSLD
jgi:hypothetical protein